MSGLAAETVLGLDNAPLTLPIAGVGSRILAALLDGLVQIALQVVWVIAFTSTMAIGRFAGAWLIVVYAAGAFLIDWAYFAGSEIAMGGRTLGKRVVGLRAVARGGGSASAGALLTRNLLRIVDLVVGVPLMVLDPLSRRLGDRLAGTLVIYDRPAGKEPLLRRIPRGWKAEDVALVESLLRRADDLESGRADELASRILARLDREDPSFLDGARAESGALQRLRRAFGLETA